MSTLLVRLKPYDRKRGNVLRSYTVYSMRFREKNGWYEVEQEIAALLRTVRQPPIGDRPADSMPLAFDVKTSDEAEAHEEAERKRIEERAKAISPHKVASSKRAREAVAQTSHDLTTAELPVNQQDPTIEVEVEEPAPAPTQAPAARKSTRGRKVRRGSK